MKLGPFVKIGWSEDPKRRVHGAVKETAPAQVQDLWRVGERPTIIGIVHDHRPVVERWIQWDLGAWRIKGEWFHDCDAFRIEAERIFLALTGQPDQDRSIKHLRMQAH